MADGDTTDTLVLMYGYEVDPEPSEQQRRLAPERVAGVNLRALCIESLKVFVPQEKEDRPVMGGGEWVSLREGLKGIEIG